MEPADRGTGRRPAPRFPASAFVWVVLYTTCFTWMTATWLATGRVGYHSRGTGGQMTISRHRDPGWYATYTLIVGGVALYGWFQITAMAATWWIGRGERHQLGQDGA